MVKVTKPKKEEFCLYRQFIIDLIDLPDFELKQKVPIISTISGEY
ncbi:hypothetical protein ABFG93_14205 [Pseudalkalibacillus hwajinpoensis]